jgi:hypothetical protein
VGKWGRKGKVKRDSPNQKSFFYKNIFKNLIIKLKRSVKRQTMESLLDFC